MSRNNVFKLSGNLALGSTNDNYSNSDLQTIKNSLKLLKAKRDKRKTEMFSDYNNQYQQPNGAYSAALLQPSQKSIKYNSNNYYDKPKPNNYPLSNTENSYKDSLYEMQPKSYSRQNINNDRPPAQKKNTYQPRSQPYQQEYIPPQKIIRNQNNQPKEQKANYQPKQQKSYQRQPRQEQYNDKPAFNEDISIKQMNKQNKIQIKQFDPSEFVECSQGCGRKFNPDSIEKHQANCKKVFQKKRKQFNTKEHRIVDNEQKKLMRKGEVIDKKLEEKKQKEKMPKWKVESLKFRAGLKQSKNDGSMTQEEQRMMKEATDSEMVKCHVCSRSFNEKAAEKHIPFCESKSKQQIVPKKRR